MPQTNKCSQSQPWSNRAEAAAASPGQGVFEHRWLVNVMIIISLCCLWVSYEIFLELTPLQKRLPNSLGLAILLLSNNFLAYEIWKKNPKAHGIMEGLSLVARGSNSFLCLALEHRWPL